MPESRCIPRQWVFNDALAARHLQAFGKYTHEVLLSGIIASHSGGRFVGQSPFETVRVYVGASLAVVRGKPHHDHSQDCQGEQESNTSSNGPPSRTFFGLPQPGRRATHQHGSIPLLLPICLPAVGKILPRAIAPALEKQPIDLHVLADSVAQGEFCRQSRDAAHHRQIL